MVKYTVSIGLKFSGNTWKRGMLFWGVSAFFALTPFHSVPAEGKEIFAEQTGQQTQPEKERATFPLRTIVLRNTLLEGGPHVQTMAVEWAADDATRRQGLMYRKTLAEDSGMLFVWEKPANITMWMKNTAIPLDMLFFNQNKLVGVIENTTPQSEKILSIGVPSTMVLELPAGQARKRGLVQKGWVLDFPPAERTP